MQVLTQTQETTLLCQICELYGVYNNPHHTIKNNGKFPCNFRQLRNLVATLLMLDTGLRVGEVTKLEYYDLFFDCKPATSVTVRAINSKTKTERSIPLTRRLTTILTHYVEFLYHRRLNIEDMPIIPHTKTNNQITTRAIERFVTNAAMKSLGFPVHPHMLRHTYATKLMTVTDMRTVQTLMGHKHITSTQIYTHVNSNHMKTAIENLDSLAAGGGGTGSISQVPGNLQNNITTPGANGQI